MTLHSDLSRLIKGQLDKNSISYDGWMPLHRLVARYFEMNVRHIHPVPRRVHFSDQTHASLGKLLRPDHDDTSGRDAWGTVFRLRQLIVDGANVNAFLSKNIRSATGWDGLLWHYGMHHFHLSSDVGVDGFVKRSDHLLFAILAPLDAYFVDVRPHPPKDGVEWVSQELLHIVHSNWPELIEANVLHCVCGTQLTDCEIHQLRRKNMNYAIEIDGKAIAPLGGGMAGDGSSVLCTIFASKLLRNLRHHEGSSTMTRSARRWRGTYERKGLTQGRHLSSSSSSLRTCLRLRNYWPRSRPKRASAETSAEQASPSLKGGRVRSSSFTTPCCLGHEPA